MRYLKIASALNPDTDFIELNDLNGFLCTRFETLGISRKHEFLAVNNRRFSVENKIDFKKYRLTVEILTKYSEYEANYREIINFLDRNKKSGFRLYYRPYNNMPVRYCLCSLEDLQKSQKRQPVVITLLQNSLWLDEVKSAIISQIEQEGNIFAFAIDENVFGYYNAGFKLDQDISGYYCIALYYGSETRASIVNYSYNEIPLVIRIYGECVDPSVSIYREEEDVPLKTLQILTNINEGYYVEINANAGESGVWLINSNTMEKRDYSEYVNNELGSPYFYIENGKYYAKVVDGNLNVCNCDILWQEEYNE